MNASVAILVQARSFSCSGTRPRWQGGLRGPISRRILFFRSAHSRCPTLCAGLGPIMARLRCAPWIMFSLESHGLSKGVAKGQRTGRSPIQPKVRCGPVTIVAAARTRSHPSRARHAGRLAVV
eukprot:4051993-Pyramimonas_sp.AAC.1